MLGPVGPGPFNNKHWITGTTDMEYNIEVNMIICNTAFVKQLFKVLKCKPVCTAGGPGFGILGALP